MGKIEKIPAWNKSSNWMTAVALFAVAIVGVMVAWPSKKDEPIAQPKTVEAKRWVDSESEPVSKPSNNNTTTVTGKGNATVSGNNNTTNMNSGNTTNINVNITNINVQQPPATVQPSPKPYQPTPKPEPKVKKSNPHCDDALSQHQNTVAEWEKKFK